jgi:hypothetical protein
VREADDDERGSANTPGEEEGERKHTTEQDRSGATRAADTAAVAPPPVVRSPRSPHPTEGVCSNLLVRVVGAQRGRADQKEGSRDTAQAEEAGYARPPDETEPLEIILLYK